MSKRLKNRYQEEVIPTLMEEFGIENPMAVPKLAKVVVNVGLGEATGDSGVIDKVVSYLSVITGQEPVPTLARRSIAGFKLRKDEAIGVKVTLRGERMYSFLERLLRITLPRTRDFQGLDPKSFDRSGNYSIGLSEQLVFPELNMDMIDKPRGLEVTVVTDTDELELSRALLEKLEFPFMKEK